MNFTLLGNIIQSEIKLPIQINEDFILDRATEKEIELLKSKFGTSFSEWFITPALNPFELKKEKNTYSKLSSDQLHYWVIRHEANYIIVNDFPIFNLLFPSSIYPTASIFFNNEGFVDCTTNIGNIRNIIKQLSTNFTISHVNQDSIVLFNGLKATLNDPEFQKYNFIKSSIDDFYRLIDIPNSSDLKIIGYFSIIEKLISSRKSVQINSINFQLQNKLNLLNNRSNFKIDLFSQTKPTDKTTFKTIIELLYKYRSCIAHGSEIDFKNELQILVNTKIADKLIYDLCKMTLIGSIQEPELIVDLREC